MVLGHPNSLEPIPAFPPIGLQIPGILVHRVLKGILELWSHLLAFRLSLRLDLRGKFVKTLPSVNLVHLPLPPRLLIKV